MTTRADSELKFEVLTYLSPSPVPFNQLAKDVGTTGSGLQKVIEALNLRGYETDTVTENGVRKIFASPFAWEKIKRKAEIYWERRYGDS